MADVFIEINHFVFTNVLCKTQRSHGSVRDYYILGCNTM